MAFRCRHRYSERSDLIMKILIVSWYFPPANTIGAVRLRSMARAFLHDGHDVRVLSAAEIPAAQTLPHDFPEERVAYTPWRDVRSLSSLLAKAAKNGSGRRGSGSSAQNSVQGGNTQPSSPPSQAPKASPLRAFARRIVQEVIFLPDSRVGWVPYAYRQGKRLIAEWRPDVIYASGPPFSTNLIGYLLSRKFDIPLVTEFRDRWSDDPYYPPSALRGRVDRWLEERIVRRSHALVTVSEPWQKAYQARYRCPVYVAYNGYDPALLTGSSPGRHGEKLVIGYTGGIYIGRRDPSPLFEAMASLGDTKSDIVVEFLGTRPELVLPLAEKHGVGEQVVCIPPVPYDKAVEKQQQSDVLLLMQWNNPKEQGNVPGKFFEYLGARRPILVLGLEGGVPHCIVEQRSAGLLGRNSEEIAAQLRKWLAQKRSSKSIPELPPSASKGFAREEQFLQLSKSLRALFNG